MVNGIIIIGRNAIFFIVSIQVPIQTGTSMRQPSMSQDGSKAAASVLRAVSDPVSIIYIHGWTERPGEDIAGLQAGFIGSGWHLGILGGSNPSPLGPYLPPTTI